MDICDVEAFWAVADTRSFSKAADSLFITQSTVSYRIKRLEDELGYQLIKRNRGDKRVNLTEKGETFEYLAQQWINLWRQAMQLKDSEAVYTLRIAQVDWFIAYPFDVFYSKLLSEMPMIKIDVQTGHSSNISDLVSNSLIDIGFAVHPHFTNQLVCTPFFRDPMVVVCSKDSPLKRDVIRPQDLDAQHEIFWRYYGEFKLWHDQWWDQLIVPDIKIDFSIPLSFSLIKNPNNWLIAPRSVAEKQIELNTHLQIKELTNPPPDIVCYFVTRNVPEQDSAIPIKLFASFLENNKDIFTTNPYMEI